MALPVIPKKQFEVRNKYLPKGKVNMIPFNVGLEDTLIQVKDATEPREKIAAMRQIIEECIKTPNIDVTKLPLFVIEELFLRLKENSSGELVELAYECTNQIDDEGNTCDTPIKLELDVREFKLTEEAGHTQVVIVSDPIGIKFKYPDIEMYESAEEDLSDDIDLIIACIDSIFDGDSVFPASDHTKEELVAFWKQLTLAQKKDVYDKFFTTMPHLHYENKLICPKCKHEHKVEFNSVGEVFI